MNGIIKNFRKGRHTISGNQMIVYIENVKNRESAVQLIGKNVAWESPGGKTINGVVRNSHGNKGAIRVLFEKGMPGQAIGAKVVIDYSK